MIRQKAESEKWREFAYSIQEFIAEKKLARLGTPVQGVTRCWICGCSQGA